MRKRRNGRKQRYLDQTPLINDAAAVPSGYVQIARLVTEEMPRPKTLMKVLSDAHRTGKLDAVKLVRRVSEIRTAPVYVDRQQAERLLRDRMAEWEAEANPRPAPVVSDEDVSETALKHRRVRAERKAWLEARLDGIEQMVSGLVRSVEEISTELGNLRAATELRLEEACRERESRVEI